MKTDSIQSAASFLLMTGQSKEARGQPLLRYRLAGVLVSLCLHGALLLMPWHAVRDAGKEELLRVVMLAPEVHAAQHMRQEAAGMAAEATSSAYPQEPAPIEPVQASADESPQGQMLEVPIQSLSAAPAESSPSTMELGARELSEEAELASPAQSGRPNVFRAPGSPLVSVGNTDPLRPRALSMKYALQQQAGHQPEAIPQPVSPVTATVQEAGVAAAMEKNLTAVESSAQTVLTDTQSAALTSGMLSKQGPLQPLLRGEAVLPITARSVARTATPQAASQESRAPEATVQAMVAGAPISVGAPAVAPAGLAQTASAPADTGTGIAAADMLDASVAQRLPAGEGAAIDYAPQSAEGAATFEVQEASAAVDEVSPGLAGNPPRTEPRERPADGTVIPQEAHTPETSLAQLIPLPEQPSQNYEVPMRSASSPPQPAYDDPAEIVTRIAELLRQYRTYPDAALRRKVEGIVQVALAIAPDGSLASAQLHKKSGSAVLDNAALALVRAIFPLRVRLAKPLAIIVPVEYRLPR